MTNQFGIIEPPLYAQPEPLPIALLRVPHQGGKLDVAYPAFGPNLIDLNLVDTQRQYSHPETLQEISFREPTTSESISAAAYEFTRLTQPNIFSDGFLMLGWIVRSEEGVFTNTTEMNPEKLKKMLDGSEKVRGIRLINDRIAFAPYESFKQGVQDTGVFVKGGLARALEHTRANVAQGLQRISDEKHYSQAGVDVFGFDSVDKPHVRIASLNSERGSKDDMLVVQGNHRNDSGCFCNYGVLDPASQKQ